MDEPWALFKYFPCILLTLPIHWKGVICTTFQSRSLKTLSSNEVITRPYPWAIQRLVSTYLLPHKSLGRGGGGVLWTKSNLKFKVLTKFSFSFFFFLGGRGYSGHHIPKILEWGTQRILSTKFSQPKLATASQIVSHALRVCRLIMVHLSFFF